MRMSEATAAANTQSIADYLAQLLKDKKQLAAFPNVFVHMERLLDDEIGRVRSNLFQINGYVKEPLILPDGNGPPVIHTEKVYVPVKDHPEFNFVGRILGPRGLTAKQLEQETGCKVMVRGKGSMRDKKKEEQNRGKPNWEHLNDELHVLITVEDCENRAKLKLERAVEEVKKLLTVSEGEDELKKRQLMELAIINGTYRDSSSKNSSRSSPDLPPGWQIAYQKQMGHIDPVDWGLLGYQFHNKAGLDTQPRLALTHTSPTTLQSMVASQAAALRQGAPLGGAPLIISPRLQVPTTMATNGLLSSAAAGGPPPLINPADTQQLLYAQYGIAADYSTYAGLTSPLMDYTTDNAGLQKERNRQVLAQARLHPYTRP